MARKTNSLCRVLSLLSNKHRKAVPTLRRDSETLPSLPCARRGAEGRACRAGPGANAPGGRSRGGSWQTARSVVREPRSVALHFSGRAPRNLCRHSFLLPPCAPACTGEPARSVSLSPRFAFLPKGSTLRPPSFSPPTPFPPSVCTETTPDAPMLSWVQLLPALRAALGRPPLRGHQSQRARASMPPL